MVRPARTSATVDSSSKESLKIESGQAGNKHNACFRDRRHLGGLSVIVANRMLHAMSTSFRDLVAHRVHMAGLLCLIN